MLAALAAFFVGCGSGDLAMTTDAISESSVNPGNADGNKLVKVLTRNLYIGADITPFVKGGSADPGELWTNIQATNYPMRAGALAEEIVAGKPDVIGLQEAYRFDVTLLAGGRPVGGFAIDYVDILLAQLAARGSPYRKVVESTLLKLPVPLGSDLVIGVTDRDVILVRDDLETANAGWHLFATLAPVSFPGISFSPRGWTEADVKVRGSWFHFVNAHLEIADIPELVPLQYAQAWELVNALPTDGLVILVGDFNGDANASPPSPTYQLLSSALGQVIPLDAPATCCQAPLLDNATSVLHERVDLVLFRGPVTAEGAFAVGLEPAFPVTDGPPYWASDHAGVLATLRVWDPELFALR
jgi:endonuclease/exonuclease/phosphatase family metal-dependent hydrolase